MNPCISCGPGVCLEGPGEPPQRISERGPSQPEPQNELRRFSGATFQYVFGAVSVGRNPEFRPGGLPKLSFEAGPGSRYVDRGD